MFWGLKINKDKIYSRLLDKSIHITHGVLDPSIKTDGVVELHVMVNEFNYIITLFDQNNGVIQQSLNIQLSSGEEIAFYLEGSDNKACVHLSGYYHHDDNMLLQQPMVNHKLSSDSMKSDITQMDNVISPPAEYLTNKQKSKKRKRVSFDSSHGIIHNDVVSPITINNEDVAETIKDLKYGHGKIAKNGKTIYIRYTGRNVADKKIIERIGKGDKPMQFQLGKGEVMKGLDKGIKGMRVGGTRRIMLSPAEMKIGTLHNKTIELLVDLVSVD